MLDSDDDSSVSSSSTARTDIMSMSGTEDVLFDQVQDTLLDQALDALDEKRYFTHLFDKLVMIKLDLELNALCFWIKGFYEGESFVNDH